MPSDQHVVLHGLRTFAAFSLHHPRRPACVFLSLLFSLFVAVFLGGRGSGGESKYDQVCNLLSFV